MFKNPALAAAAALLAVLGVVTLKKSEEIAQLRKDNKRLNSYDYFSSIFMSGHDAGMRAGWRRAGYPSDWTDMTISN